MGYSTLELQEHGGVLTITLNRPEKRNALNPVLIGELTAALADAAGSCGVLILTGAGSAFCAGLDLEQLEKLNELSAEEHRADSLRISRLLRALYDFPQPTIAAVNGPAIAGGMGIATVCDFTLAVPEAKFGYTEVRIGFVPAIVSSFLLRQVGEKRTRDLLLTGRILMAEEAMEWGLVTRLIPEESLLPFANELAQRLLQNSGESLTAVKRLLSEHAAAALDAELEAGIEWNARQRGTDDFKEGIRAFLEKRPPQWPSRRG